jgi:hypothetical protein
MTDQKWMLPMAGLLGTLALLIGVLLAVGGTGADGDVAGNAATERCAAGAEDCDDTGGFALGVCVEGVPDCVDTVVNPDGDVGDCPDGVVCDDVGVSPDEPVSSDPGAGESPNSGDLVDPNECSTVHNIDACERQATEAAVGDLATRLGVESGEIIAAFSAEFVQWPDSCLGVTSDGVFCAEVITPGFRIILEYAGTQYEYHTDTAGNLAFVE